MIKFTNNTTKLRENKKDFLDMNPIVNEQMNEVIKGIKSKLNSISSEHEAEVTLTGKIDNSSLNVKSESTETVNIIEKLVNDYLK
jgi:predicted transcriptional regulator